MPPVTVNGRSGANPNSRAWVRTAIAVIASSAGGMDIEEVAQQTPEKILAVNVHPAAGLQPYQCRELAFALKLSGKQLSDFQSKTT